MPSHGKTAGQSVQVAQPVGRKANGQFRKGASGNPLGRPRRRLNTDYSEKQHAIDIVEELERPILLSGKKVPGIVLLIRMVIEHAITGDQQSEKHFTKLIKVARSQSQAIYNRRMEKFAMSQAEAEEHRREITKYIDFLDDERPGYQIDPDEAFALLKTKFG